VGVVMSDNFFFAIMAILFAACGIVGIFAGVYYSNEIWIFGGCVSYMVLAIFSFVVHASEHK
jgi:hypothetical protein